MRLNFSEARADESDGNLAGATKDLATRFLDAAWFEPDTRADLEVPDPEGVAASYGGGAAFSWQNAICQRLTCSS